MDRLRRFPTPPPLSITPGFSEGTFSMWQRTNEDHQEIAEFLSISFDEAASMNSKLQLKYMGLRALMEESYADLRHEMTKEGRHSSQLQAIIDREERVCTLQADDTVMKQARAFIPIMKTEERKEAARQRIRVGVATKDPKDKPTVYTLNLETARFVLTSDGAHPPECTADALKAIVADAVLEGPLDDGHLNKKNKDPVIAEAHAEIARRLALQSIRESMAEVVASNNCALTQSEVLEEVYGNQTVRGRLELDELEVKAICQLSTDLQAQAHGAHAKLREVLEVMNAWESFLQENLDQQIFEGNLDADDAFVNLTLERIRLAHEKELKTAAEARVEILAGMKKFTSSELLRKCLDKHMKLGGPKIGLDDPTVKECLARIKELQEDESGSDDDDDDEEEEEDEEH